MVVFNDWSARDSRNGNMYPLGPSQEKNFGSSVSPWIVTLDALEPFGVRGLFKTTCSRLPEPRGAHNFDLDLEVCILSENGAENCVSRSNMKLPLLEHGPATAHPSVNGCNVQAGDMMASGTISGPAGSYGSMLELSGRERNR